jgi:hypothetical protein
VKQAVTFRLPPELLTEAKRIALRSGTTATAVVEEGLHMVIEARGDAVARLQAHVDAQDERIARLERIVERMVDL